MATGSAGLTFVEQGISTPIAQLSPDLPDIASRVVSGEITITWPYNSIKKTLAFLVAEHDVRLRCVKGQVRVELSGSSAQAVVDSGLGAGDAVVLSLAGVEFMKDETPGRVPGARVDWKLRFCDRVTVKVSTPSGLWAR
jgi:hypothetical protein